MFIPNIIMKGHRSIFREKDERHGRHNININSQEGLHGQQHDTLHLIQDHGHSDEHKRHSSCLSSQHNLIGRYWTRCFPIQFNVFFYCLLIIVLMLSLFILIFYLSPSISSHKHLHSSHNHAHHDSLLHAKHMILRDMLSSPRHIIEDDDPQAHLTNASCNHYNCFDVFRCGSKNDNIRSDEDLMNVYIYPSVHHVDITHASLTTPASLQFWQLLEAIVESPYYTSDPKKACLFVPNIDLLNQNYVRLEEASQILESLPYWSHDGSNHLIFNMIPGSFPDYNTRLDVNLGKAIIAGGGFDVTNFRRTFDVSIPVYSPYSKDVTIDENQIKTRQRKWLLVGVQFDAISHEIKDVLQDIEEEYSSQVLMLSHHCSPQASSSSTNESSGHNLCHHNQNDDQQKHLLFNYPKILLDSTFCLVIRTAYLGQAILSDSLMSGCIPVIIADNYVMPFDDRIDWTQASVRINEYHLVRIMDILESISQERIALMRQQVLFLWQSYFSSMKVITLATLKIINERLFPQTAQSIQQWNQPAFDYLVKPFPLINQKLSHGFTALILTYDRVESLFQVIRSIIKVPSCVKVLVIWNNQNKLPPPLEKWPKAQIPIQVIRTKANKLSNRFYPYEQIVTDAILAIDDDIVMLTQDELEFAYQTWREFPDRIVGFPSRVHRWDNSTMRWRYESEWTNDISMVLTGAAFYHKHYNYLYTNKMPHQIKKYVDEKMNCEDIAMNFLVSNITGKSPIKVTPRKKFRCPECTSSNTLSFDVVNHLAERSDCINYFTAIFGLMPLKSVQFRADPVLYKDNLPEKLKMFNSIGSL